MMLKIRLLGVWLLAAALFSTGLDAAEQVSADNTGLPIGQQAPTFTLKDQNDKEVALNALVERGPVALVFSRSADW
jgi:cytochrome oxidase Cu insertion factor (SCO1/SenC/PrrC family)